jgi:2',3'-cyclic-nucleotide 2'-phosphodiesterase (5'-nucleotidase family)
MGFESLVEQDLNTVIGTLAADWRTSFDEESNTGNWEADVFREFAGTDIGLVNSGGLRKSMFAGTITKRDIWEMNPFGNTLVTFTLSGRQLLQMLEWQASKKGELMQISGLRYNYDPDAPDGKKVIEATTNGRGVDTQRSYTAVTNNFVAGHAKQLLGIEPGTITDLYAIDRDVLIDYVLRHGTISSTVEGRIVRRGQPSGKENR